MWVTKRPCRSLRNPHQTVGLEREPDTSDAHSRTKPAPLGEGPVCLISWQSSKTPQEEPVIIEIMPAERMLIGKTVYPGIFSSSCHDFRKRPKGSIIRGMAIEGGLNNTFGRIVDLDIPPLEYYGLVRRFNDLIQTELNEKLKDKGDWLGSAVTLVTPGSDGRREKGSMASPLEVIALVDAQVDTDTLGLTITSALQEMSSTRVSKVEEFKGPDSKMAFFRDNPHRVQPGRIADSRLIFGSAEDAKAAKIRLGHEIVNLPRHSIVDKVDDLRKDGRHATERGQNRIGGSDAIHFDTETGIVYFNPSAHQLSFKVGPLRLVQNTLLSEEVKHTRRERDTNFISTLHSGIVTRLGQLSDDSMLNLTRASTEELAEHYAFFLRLYHRSEEGYVQRKEVALQLTPQENEEVAKRLKSLLEIMKIFKIQKQPR